ncbi:MAG: HigA family addiction module antitoxin [Cyclobacteriaceae bacterium]|nr:MAG: HigA family addiction module antitoxin [Cyclobacteriaceae bacterium]
MINLSPVEILKHQYIIPSSLSMLKFAKAAGIDDTAVRNVVSCKRMMSSRFISKLARFTGTNPMYWHELQVAYQFSKYLAQNTRRPIISKIKAKPKRIFYPNNQLNLHAHEVLHKNYTLEERSQSIIDQRILNRILSGTKRINFKTAFKLSSVFKESNPIHWLKIQLALDIDQYIEKRAKIPEQLKFDLLDYKNNLQNQPSTNQESLLHPGITLNSSIIIPSKIRLIEWSHIFSIGKKRLRNILHGKDDLSLDLSIKLSQLFDTAPTHWLNLQLLYYTNLKVPYVTNERIDLSKRRVGVRENVMKPGDVLYENYLFPMRWKVHEFASHIGVKVTRLDHLKQGSVNIDFDLALRISEALGMDPMFWLKLQLVYSIKHNKSLPLR